MCTSARPTSRQLWTVRHLHFGTKHYANNSTRTTLSWTPPWTSDMIVMVVRYLQSSLSSLAQAHCLALLRKRLSSLVSPCHTYTSPTTNDPVYRRQLNFISCRPSKSLRSDSLWTQCKSIWQRRLTSLNSLCRFLAMQVNTYIGLPNCFGMHASI